jgi:hypothetical protein
MTFYLCSAKQTAWYFSFLLSCYFSIPTPATSEDMNNLILSLVHWYRTSYWRQSQAGKAAHCLCHVPLTARLPWFPMAFWPNCFRGSRNTHFWYLDLCLKVFADTKENSGIEGKLTLPPTDWRKLMDKNPHWDSDPVACAPHWGLSAVARDLLKLLRTAFLPLPHFSLLPTFHGTTSQIQCTLESLPPGWHLETPK